MTPEQAQLVLQIVSQLGADWAQPSAGMAIKCKYCNGNIQGYSDSYSFEHDSDCVVLKIEQLRQTMLD